MRTPHLYITIILIFIGVFIISYSYRIGIGSITHPGSGLFPFLIGSALFLLSLYKFNAEIKRKAKEEVDQGPVIFKKMIGLASSLLFFALFLQSLGYLITTFITIGLILWIAGYKSLFRILVYTLIIVFISYFIFSTLGVRFPKGIVG